MADESGEKTEPATQKRMKDVHKKGKLQKSQDVTAWAGIGAFAVMLPVTFSKGTEAAKNQLSAAAAAASNPDPLFAVQALGDGLATIIPTLLPAFIAVVIATVLAAAVQGGIHIKEFKGKFEQFDLVKGVKGKFGLQAHWQGAKALLKTIAIGVALYIVVQNLMPVLLTSGGLSMSAILEAAKSGTVSLLQTAIMAGIALAVLDFIVVMKKNQKQTKMTKKEVKDENKNTDGDPLIKSQRRSRQMQMSRNRMIGAIADSDVVLVNPTEYAVAIKYDQENGAPRVTAKGSDLIAARIRAEAEAHGIPMVKDIPLTRHIHKNTEIGHPIPTDTYTDVARILTFVIALKKRGSTKGVHTVPQTGALR